MKMDPAEYFRLLEAKGDQSLVVYSSSRRNPSNFVLSHTIVAAFLLFSAVVASGYYVYQQSPQFRDFIDSIFSSPSGAIAPEAIKSDFTRQQAAVILARGNTLRVKGQHKEAKYAYQASLEKFSLKKDNSGLGNVHTEMGILSTQTEGYKFAEEQFQQALTYFTWAESFDGLGYAHFNLAQLHFVQGQFITAEELFQISAYYYKESDNKEGQGNATLSLANVYMATNHFLKATWFFKKAEPLFKQAGNNRGLVTTYNALGRAYLNIGTEQGDKESRRYYQLAKSIELNTDSKDLPDFSIRDNLKWLVSAFDQHKDIYEGELSAKARQETERALR